MTNLLEWVEPPHSTAASEVVDALCARPGEWARIIDNEDLNTAVGTELDRRRISHQRERREVASLTYATYWRVLTVGDTT